MYLIRFSKKSNNLEHYLSSRVQTRPNAKIKNSRYINEKMIIIINKNIIYYIILNKTLFCKLKKKLSFNNINNL